MKLVCRLVYFLAISVVVVVHNRSETLSSRAVRDVSSELEIIRSKHGLPGIAGVIVVEDQAVLEGASGVRKFGNESKVTVQDRFHAGSITKSMTATLAGLLVESGKIKWITTIEDVFGKTGMEIHSAYKSVTLEQLLSHRGGAPHEPPAELWMAAWREEGSYETQRLQFVRGLLAKEPTKTPGTEFVYSNQGYAIAGVMLETVAKMPWETLMREKIFQPLGMKSAAFGVPGVLGEMTEPWGHVFQSGQWIPKQADNPPAIGPAGTVHASVGDIARYAAIHLRGDRGLTTPILKPDSWKKLHQPTTGQDYALGWVVKESPWKRGKALWHNGSNTMFYMVVWVVPEDNMVAVVAVNAASPAARIGSEEAVTALVGLLKKDRL